MLVLNGKSNIKLIQEMLDVVYFTRSGGFRRDMKKVSKRGAYKLEYNAWTGESGYPEYRVKLIHYNAVIYDVVSRNGYETIKQMLVTSDSDRNAINSLIDYLGIVPVEIWREKYTWYSKMYCGLIRDSNLIYNVVSVKDEYMTIEF